MMHIIEIPDFYQDEKKDNRKGGKHFSVFHAVFSVTYYDGYDNVIHCDYGDNIISASDLFEARKEARKIGNEKYSKNGFYWCNVMAI